MSSRTILLIFINIGISVLMAKLIFKNFKNFKRALYYIVYPDIISILKKDYDNDFNYTHKMLLFVVVLFALILVEVKLFY